MPARVEFSQRLITVGAQGLDDAEVSALLARTAREVLASAIADGSGSPVYRRFVNGAEGRPEESVKAPGPILYEFDWMQDVATYVLAFLRARSPRFRGHYQEHHFMMAQGRRIERVEDIPPGVELIITNDEPYARKIHVGAKGFRVSKGIYENARQALQSKFGELIYVELKFIQLPGGYVLRGRRPRKAAAQNRRSSVFRAGGQFLAARKDTAEGQPMTYPALVINLRH